MPIGRLVRMPDGFRWPAAARARMPRIDVSDFAVELARLAGVSGLLHLFDPADYSVANGAALDRASGTTWSRKDAGGDGPVVSAINGKTALSFTRGTSRRLVSSAVRPAGSFSVAMAWTIAAGDAAAQPCTIMASGANSAGYNNSGQLIFTLGGDQMVCNETPGTHVGIFSYDEATKELAYIRRNGTVANRFTSPSAAGAGDRWNIGGWFFDGNDPTMKAGRFMVFNKALHLDANLPTAAALLNLLGTEYNVAT